MEYTVKNPSKSEVELTITVKPEDYKQAMEKAAVKISEIAGIKGFRPGKAPYDIVKREAGELKIMEHAMQNIVESNYSKAAGEAELLTIGMPQITIEKMAPGNDFIFKATVALLPEVKLADISSLKVKRDSKEIDDKQVDEVIDNLSKMRRKEALKNGPAAKEDKIVIDLDMFLDKVPVEGGQAKKHQVYLSEAHYIPGLNEQLIGLKKDEIKEFSLKFPKEHYQKNLAGKNIDFRVKAHEVFKLETPEIDDEFAKSLGQESLAKLKELLKENLKKEAEEKDEQRIEAEIFEKLIEKSSFGEIPQVLLDAEKTKMFHELKHQLTRQGADMEKYLKDIKKTEEEIKKDFAEQADKRVKAALISRQIALDFNLKVEKEELEKELELIKQTYGNDKTVEENLKKPEVLDTIATTIQNQKVIKLLKEKVLGDEEKKK